MTSRTLLLRGATLAVFVTAAGALAAEPVPLRLSLAPGQGWSMTLSQAVEAKNQAVAGGQTQSFTTKQEQKRSGTVQVLAVAGGVPTSIKVTFDPTCSTTNTTNDQPQPGAFAYAGQTVTLTRQADGSVTDDFTGQAPPGDQADLHNLLDQDLVLMPNKPVAVGDEWPGDPRVVARVLQLKGRDTGGMTLKLLSTGTQNGRPTADVKVSFAAVNDVNGISIKTIAQGTCTVDLSTGHVTKADYTGSLDVSGQQQTQGPDGQPMTVNVTGQGTAKISGEAPLTGAGPVAGGGAPAAVPAPGPAGNPLAGTPPFAGTFSDGKLKVELRPKGDGYDGTLTLNGNAYPATAAAAAGTLSGSFTAGGQSFPFTAALSGDTLDLTSGATIYHLKRAATNPLDGGPGNGPVNPLAPR